MKRIFLLVVITAVLTACVSNGKPNRKELASSACDKTKGFTQTKLYYEKGEDEDIRMKWKSRVSKGAEFRIKLKPSKELRNAMVTITGKSGEKPNKVPAPFAWLNVSGKYSDKKQLIVCAPDGEDLPDGTEYKFDVHVVGIGTLDPRVEVTY